MTDAASNIKVIWPNVKKILHMVHHAHVHYDEITGFILLPSCHSSLWQLSLAILGIVAKYLKMKDEQKKNAQVPYYSPDNWSNYVLCD